MSQQQTTPSQRITFMSFLAAAAALLGPVGDILGFYEKISLSGRVFVFVVAILSLFAFVFGLLTTGNKKNGSLIRTLSIVSLILGLAGLLYFVPVGILLQFTESPPIQGWPIKETAGKRHDGTIILDNAQVNGNDLISKKTLTFGENADFAEALLSVTDEDKKRVKKISVKHDRPTGVTIKTMPRKDDTVDGFYVEPSSESLQIPIEINITKQNGGTEAPIKVNVFYKYWRKDKQWRVLQWIHGRYA